MIRRAIDKVVNEKKPLSGDEIVQVLNDIENKNATEAQICSLIVALNVLARGNTLSPKEQAANKELAWRRTHCV